MALGLLSDDEAVELLLKTAEMKRWTEHEAAAAKKLAKLCGHLPLYLTLVGRLIYEFAGSAGSCWDEEVVAMLEQDRSSVLGGAVGDSGAGGGALGSQIVGSTLSRIDDPEAAALFTALAVAAEGVAIPMAVVELIWRAHLLSPVAYARDCAELRGGGESTRLIDHAPLPVESYASRDATMAINAAVAPTSMPQAWHADLMAAVRRQAAASSMERSCPSHANLCRHRYADVRRERLYKIRGFVAGLTGPRKRAFNTWAGALVEAAPPVASARHAPAAAAQAAQTRTQAAHSTRACALVNTRTDTSHRDHLQRALFCQQRWRLPPCG